MSDTITLINVGDLHESPFNPRKVFHEGALQELAADILAQGRVLQPLLVRPRVPDLFHGDPDAACGHEIVFGHRRFRAAQLAGVEQLPCMVRSMSDDEAKRAQISENLHRTDVHAIEEAEGFQALIDGGTMTADSLAEQFGKSRSYVYGRLKLLAACPAVRTACLNNEIGSEVALLIARLRTEKLQQKALARIAAIGADLEDGGKRSYRRIRDELNEMFTLDLKTALFDTASDTLLPGAGTCTTCPKRSGNAPEFTDVVDENKRQHWNRLNVGANVCTDPDCFAAKKVAHLKREARALEAKGKTVIDGNKARAAVGADGTVKGAYVALKDVRSLLKASKAATPATVVIQDPRSGKTIDAVKIEDLKAAGVAAPKAARSSGYSEANHPRDRMTQEEAEAQAAAETDRRTQLLGDTLATMAGKPRTTDDLVLIARCVFDGCDYSDRETLAARHDQPDAIRLSQALNLWPADQLALFAIECVLIEESQVDAYAYKYHDGPKACSRLDDLARRYGMLAEPAPTPAPAARAPKSAKAAAKRKAAPAPDECTATGADEEQEEQEEQALRAQDQTDDAGVAGGPAATAGHIVDVPELQP